MDIRPLFLIFRVLFLIFHIVVLKNTSFLTLLIFFLISKNLLSVYFLCNLCALFFIIYLCYVTHIIIDYLLDTTSRNFPQPFSRFNLNTHFREGDTYLYSDKARNVCLLELEEMAANGH